MRMNVAYNGVGETPASNEPPNPADDENDQNVEQEADEKAEVNPEECTLNGYDGPARELGRRPGCKGKVRVTEGDAW